MGPWAQWTVQACICAACKSVYAEAKDLDELLRLSLQESYCLPVWDPYIVISQSKQ